VSQIIRNKNYQILVSGYLTSLQARCRCRCLRFTPREEDDEEGHVCVKLRFGSWSSREGYDLFLRQPAFDANIHHMGAKFGDSLKF
jgi:hypothetical protein